MVNGHHTHTRQHQVSVCYSTMGITAITSSEDGYAIMFPFYLSNGVGMSHRTGKVSPYISSQEAHLQQNNITQHVGQPYDMELTILRSPSLYLATSVQL